MCTCVFRTCASCEINRLCTCGDDMAGASAECSMYSSAGRVEIHEFVSQGYARDEGIMTESGVVLSSVSPAAGMRPAGSARSTGPNGDNFFYSGLHPNIADAFPTRYASICRLTSELSTVVHSGTTKTAARWWALLQHSPPSTALGRFCPLLWQAWVVGLVASSILLLDASVWLYVGCVRHVPFVLYSAAIHHMICWSIGL